jgi:hypothetical protein
VKSCRCRKEQNRTKLYFYPGMRHTTCGRKNKKCPDWDFFFQRSAKHKFFIPNLLHKISVFYHTADIASHN